MCYEIKINSEERNISFVFKTTFKTIFELYIFAKEKYEEKVKRYILLETVKQFLKRNSYFNKDFFFN